jgi:hypothetical protein
MSMLRKESKGQMETTQGKQKLVAVFPLSNTELLVICGQPVHPSMAQSDQFRLKSGLPVHDVRIEPAWPERLLLHVAPMRSQPLTVDEVSIRDLRSADGASLGTFVSPPFIQGIQTPMELKIPHLQPAFPYTSTLTGLHASVMCCTGCNGGIHARGLVVLNNHAGGSWSSIWIRTEKTIDTPYPRWQRVLFAGGVIAEDNGSLEAIDRGWMVIRKSDEPAHHAPPPLPIKTEDLPAEPSTLLLSKSLDGVWVQFDDIVLESVRAVLTSEDGLTADNLPHMEIVFHDSSGGHSRAWLYQTSARRLQPQQTIKRLRGFIHAEELGVYILLSDKEEDIGI